VCLIQSVCIDGTDLPAWSRRDPRNPSWGLSDPEAQVGRGRRRSFFLGYKSHCSGDWNSEMPTAYLVAPANENEKRHFKEVASEAKERFPNARWHVADNQYSSKRLRKYIEEQLKGRPVIPRRRDEKRGAGDLYVDRRFRCREDRRMCGLYGRRTASERMNSRTERLMSRNTLRGLGRVRGDVGVALTPMLLVAAASYRHGRPELVRSMEHYASY